MNKSIKIQLEELYCDLDETTIRDNQDQMNEGPLKAPDPTLELIKLLSQCHYTDQPIEPFKTQET